MTDEQKARSIEDLPREEVEELQAEEAEQAVGGKVAMQDLHFTMKVNKASPQL